MEKKFTTIVTQVQTISRVNHGRAVETASMFQSEAIQHCEKLLHIEDHPPFTANDYRYDWYYVSDSEDLAAVKLANYDPDAAAFDKKLPEYPTWIMISTSEEGYGDIEVTSQMNLAEIVGTYVGQLIVQMQKLTAPLYED